MQYMPQQQAHQARDLESARQSGVMRPASETEPSAYAALLTGRRLQRLAATAHGIGSRKNFTISWSSASL